jgi:uncharacterized RDD family membrane protein YckC
MLVSTRVLAVDFPQTSYVADYETGESAVERGDQSTRRAVWFSPDAYAGFWRRLGVESVDIACVLLVAATLLMAFSLATGDDDPHDAIVLLTLLPTAYLYLVVVKWSRFGTVGYWLFRVRLVDAAGRQPGLGTLSLRFLFAVAGPINIVLDMLWIPSDRWRQSLRDKLAHTYVVKAGAEPAGTARVVYRQHYLMGMSFVFQELEPLSAPSTGR